MAEPKDAPAGTPSLAADRGARLDSWKEIAAYVKRDVRTLQRWEKTAGLPVRRLQKPGLRAVYAYTADLDQWLLNQSGADDTLKTPGAEPTSELPAVAEPRPQRWRIGIWALAVVTIIGAAAFALRPRATAALGPFTARPITSEPGNERDPDVSPDGKYIAYAYQAPNLRTRIVVRLIDGGEPHYLTDGAVDEWSPVWSPDGARLAFLRGDPAGTATLVLITAHGDNERTLGDVRPYARRRLLLVGHLLAWTPDGRHIISAHQSTDGRGGLVRISIETGGRTVLTSPADAEFDVEPSLSSDGRLMLFNRMRGEYLSDVYRQRLDASFQPLGAAAKLPPAGPWNGTPRLLEDRNEVLTSSGPLPRLTLWRQPVDGTGSPVQLGFIGDNATQSAVDRASGRIVARTFRSQADVLRFPLPSTPARGPVDPPVEDFLQSTYIDRAPVYSPDGSHVAFISDRSGSRQLWVADADGANHVEWSQPFEVDMPMPAWAPDGSRIAFAGLASSGHTQLFVADRATRVAVRITNDDLDYVRPVWAPDGKALYAAAAARSVYSIYRVPLAGGPSERVVPDRINVIDVAPDGRGLYVVRRDRRLEAELEYVPLASGPAVHLASMSFQDDAWMTPRGLYYFARRGNTPLAPVALSFRSHEGVVTVIQEYARPPGRGLSVSADGRFAVTTRFVPAIADLLLLERAR